MKARKAASVFLAISVAIGLAGCSAMTPQATTFQYDPGDGLGADVGNVLIRNAMLVTEDGVTATLVAGLLSSNNETQSLSIQYEAADGKRNTQVTVRPNGHLGLPTNDLAAATLRGLDVVPGSTVKVYFQSGDDTGVELDLPVLTGDFADYAEYVPTS